jgi:hypothetical protein
VLVIRSSRPRREARAAGSLEELSVEVMAADGRLKTRPWMATVMSSVGRHQRLCEADDGPRTRDLRLGKPTLYQLSYVRVSRGF